VIAHTPPGPVYTGDPIAIDANVTDYTGQVASVWLVYTPVGGPERNVTMTPRILPTGARVWSYTIPGQSSSGTVAYRIYAVDAQGNVASADFTVAVRARPSAPPLDIVPFVAVAVIAAIAVLAAVLYLRRRRRGSEPPTPPTKPMS